MSSTATSRSGVDDLGPDALLAALKNTETRRRQAELDQLHLAYQWCVLHPPTADTGVAVWGGDGDLDADESLGGDGTPMVAAFAPEPFGLALGVSTDTAKTLLADALDLVHRLPHTWRRLQTLEVPVWRGRRLAQKTHALNVKAAAHVDRLLAPQLHTVGVTRLDRAVAHAIAKYMPDEHADREARSRQTWDVTLHHPNPTEYAGTSELHITGDTLTLTNLYDQICAGAADLKQPATPTRSGSARPKPSAASPARPKTKLYLHLDPRTRVSTGSTTEHRVGRVENLGPATTAKIRAWLGDTKATIQPVLRTDRTDAVDAHDPPTWMRDLVILRDPTCVFPHCERHSRSCDLDHIVPFDDTGPPGQTQPDNLAPLCRRHHRAKTSGRWTYQRLPDGTYTWTGPGVRGVP